MAKDPSDRALTERILRDGDERAFRELYRRHTPYLYQFTLRVLGGVEADAEDVVQETWVRAMKSLERFRWRSSLRTWLGGIALNRARDRLRRAGREEGNGQPVELATPPASVPDRIDLERAIARLPDGYRMVLVLHDVEGFTHQEIADRMGIAPVTSRSQLSRARNQLRALLHPVAAPG